MLFVSNCLRVSREKREDPLRFFFLFVCFACPFFKSTCSGTLNVRAAMKKKIPVFVSKFREIVFNFLLFLFCFFFLLSLF